MEERSILIVDDEKAIVKMLETVLRKEGFSTIYTAYNAEEAFHYVKNYTLDVILLDVMLPVRSGFDLCPQIRGLTQAYILFLTAKVSDLDKLTGFAIGADDYVTKPFNPLEIVARINARLRREVNSVAKEQVATTSMTKGIFTFDRFTVNELAGELLVDGRKVPCPAQVFLLLCYFCKHPNRFLSKEQLLEAVWGMDSFVDDNTVMVHIRRIRERIEIDPSHPRYLVTVRGLGYKLVKEPEA
ncbi:response regulator transcription factor [Halalkalibacterium halodurans]|uniref:response regulator transcription factor n=1 Tax=Halalkalibacterium halodurans TaxID=86665 RepID=UPI001067E57C|nr:response regulator transcription factor [Halalkalibacterium halodurans]MED3645279.1 response regulator transcription factor [Halalkalibacterium halodurans]TES54306.1 response regulator transcription factor [Halalkalibacterium halodurans]